jgi:hypothetical protein
MRKNKIDPTTLKGFSLYKELRKPKRIQQKRRRFPTSQEQRTFDYPFTQRFGTHARFATCGSLGLVLHSLDTVAHLNGDHPFCLQAGNRAYICTYF